MQSLKDGLAAIRKQFGAESGGKGASFPAFTRLPTGILNLDVALAGGIPMGAVSIIYGAEGSGKTNLALRIVAEFQKRYPEKAVGWMDVENQFDPPWAKLHKVDVENLYLFKPTTAEQCSDMAGEIAMSEDVGLLVVDSIAAMASYDQLEKDSDKVVMAGSAKPSTTMLRKIGGGMVEHTKAGGHLTVIYINQIRHKIGFVLGNPEILPGPSYQNYQAFLKLRLSAKPILKEKISPVPIYSENSAKITKKKFPAIRQTAEWSTILYPYEGHKPLDVNNAKTLEVLLDEIGWLEKDGNHGWLLNGEVFPTKTAAVAHALADYDVTLNELVAELLQLYKVQSG